MKIVFIDGYNVINSWPNLKETAQSNQLEAGRKKLIETIENYSSFNQCKVFIVFDAHKVQCSVEKEEIVGKNKQIKVIYTKTGETADSYIERMVNEFGKKYEVVVVTSDNLEQQTIFQRGATRMNSLEFYFEVLKIENQINEKAKKVSRGKKFFLSDNIDDKVAEALDKLRKGNL
ncbi:MAG: NYN domain-containing protein [Sarcina sp.]